MSLKSYIDFVQLTKLVVYCSQTVDYFQRVNNKLTQILSRKYACNDLLLSILISNFAFPHRQNSVRWISKHVKKSYGRVASNNNAKCISTWFVDSLRPYVVHFATLFKRLLFLFMYIFLLLFICCCWI